MSVGGSSLLTILVRLIGCAFPSTQSKFPRCFSTTSPQLDWLTPKFMEKSKSPKGRPKMHTGGSTRGTTVVWGDYGLRMKDHDRRVSAGSLKIGEETIRRRLRGMNFTLYKRVSANIGVYTSGNEMRMGKGKGKFDYWAARIPVSRIVFEVKGDLHEKVAREAFRLAAHKLPGTLNTIVIEVFRHLMLMILIYRTLGVCQERRTTSCWYHEIGQRCHTRKPQAPTKVHSFGR
jgi:ribosomal protein L16